MTRVESLRGQLASSLIRFAALQRRAGRLATPEGLLPHTLDELQRSLSELEVAVQELRDQSARLEAAQREAEEERGRSQVLFERAPTPYILTDDTGTIRDVNDAGASLLAISRKFLVGKTITVFVDGRRVEFLEDVARAVTADQPVTITFTLRPRERAPQPASAILHRFTLPDGTCGLWWVFTSR